MARASYPSMFVLKAAKTPPPSDRADFKKRSFSTSASPLSKPRYWSYTLMYSLHPREGTVSQLNSYFSVLTLTRNRNIIYASKRNLSVPSSYFCWEHARTLHNYDHAFHKRVILGCPIYSRSRLNLTPASYFLHLDTDEPTGCD